MSQRTAFVTGATGFLGQNLCEQLMASGNWHVVGLHRNGSDTELLERLGVELAVGDILDAESLNRAMPAGTDAVFHTAAMTSMWRKDAELQAQINVTGTGNVVRAALSKGAGRFIHTSTWNVFDRSTGSFTEQSEKTGTRSWITYDRTKHEAEEIVLGAVADHGLDAVITNPSHILGRYDRQNWSRLIMLAARGKLPGVPSGSGDFAHGEEVARAHISAVDRGRSGENYILAGPHESFLGLVQSVAQMANQPKVPKKPVPPALLRIMGTIEPRVASFFGRTPDITPEAVALVTADMHAPTGKATDELGYDPPPVQYALEDCYKWLMRTGMLTSD
jgi:dihydroflavonol-4-reductase